MKVFLWQQVLPIQGHKKGIARLRTCKEMSILPVEQFARAC